MAKILAIPEVRPDIDKARLEIKIQFDNKIIEIELMRGYTENGEFKISSTISCVILSTEYDAIMGAVGDNGKELGAQLEDKIWDWLVSKGYIVLA